MLSARTRKSPTTTLIACKAPYPREKCPTVRRMRRQRAPRPCSPAGGRPTVAGSATGSGEPDAFICMSCQFYGRCSESLVRCRFRAGLPRIRSGCYAINKRRIRQSFALICPLLQRGSVCLIGRLGTTPFSASWTSTIFWRKVPFWRSAPGREGSEPSEKSRSRAGTSRSLFHRSGR